MADAKATPTSLDGVTALYRRFRPGRFAELRGQDHVVRALQGAVKNDRVSHAYLFSGPRGTGKTTTARILAKALNCENPVDGDACGTCASCLAITKGTSLDVIELDAASNNGVDPIREIISGAWHGTPGRWKVYIFDEVHQLSKAASAALLKTLEEPPPHVVFVLATTDPHKVLPTIRSRTQHLEFRLIGAETLGTLLHDVQGAAGLGADDATVEAAVRLGRGSARDALSALDQLLATGSISETQPEFDPLFEALAHEDAVAALRSLAVLAREGWDPEQLAENFAGEVRQAFLLQVAPEVADAVDADRERLRKWGELLGLARSVRILETVGRTIREMKSAPEKMVMLEVAVVRLTKPELDHTFESLDERLTRLERGASRPSAPAPQQRTGASSHRVLRQCFCAPAVERAGAERGRRPNRSQGFRTGPRADADGRQCDRRLARSLAGRPSREIHYPGGAADLARGAAPSALSPGGVSRRSPAHHRRSERRDETEHRAHRPGSKGCARARVQSGLHSALDGQSVAGGRARARSPRAATRTGRGTESRTRARRRRGGGRLGG